MNQRVLAIVLAGAVLIGGVLVLTMFNRPAPRPTGADAAANSSPPAARESESAAARPAPATPSPPAAASRPAAPRRRATPETPEAAPTPAPVANADLVTLRVDSDVPGAQVFVDRTFLGKTPFTTTELKAGAHKLNVSAPGFEGVAQDLDLVPGSRDVVVKLREVRLNASLSVVHKHRLGSCTGRLVATPHGMRYETTNKEDGFQTALLDLDTFEVDYLEKNLRIKLKQGKRFDFSDPEGNADRLFVFHRDVEKARDRLKKGDPPAEP